jgi:WD40 repeat protein
VQKKNHTPIMSSVSRRAFLQSSTVAAAAAYLTANSGHAKATPANKSASEAIIRSDLLDEKSPPGLEVVQLTTDTTVPASHLYMEAQIFATDSKRLVLHRSATAHGGSRSDPKHQYLRCDLDDNCSLHPLTDELGVTAASVSPDDKYVYYFVDQTKPGGGRLTLKRVNLDGTQRETIQVIDSPLPGTHFRPSRPYPLSTISSDGKRLAISAFLGDGQTDDSPYGLMVFDVEQATVQLVIHGPTWCNMHPQYCRSLDPDGSHDILIQENHGNVTDATGRTTRLTGGAGADIHVIRDDGSGFRSMPWGRDGNEFCQGHQCWRGRTRWAITSTSCRDPREAQLIEGLAADHAEHVGIKMPDGLRNDLSRDFPDPHFYHFATDIEGKRLVSDAGPLGKDASIYLASLGEPGTAPASDFTYLLSPRSTCNKTAHIHPFLSPDGTMAFFNSDESGILQAYMIRGLENC